MSETNGTTRGRGTWRWGGIMVCCVFFALAPGALGQALTPTTMENVYVQPGQPAMEIYILGDVGRPGKWRVSTGAELFDVLAVATPAGTGGSSGASTRVEVEVYRTTGSTRSLVYENELDPLIMSAEAEMPLQAGDVVRVKAITKQPFNLLQAVQITTNVASLVLLVISLTSGN